MQVNLCRSDYVSHLAVIVNEPYVYLQKVTLPSAMQLSSLVHKKSPVRIKNVIRKLMDASCSQRGCHRCISNPCPKLAKALIESN